MPAFSAARGRGQFLLAWRRRPDACRKRIGSLSGTTCPPGAAGWNQPTGKTRLRLAFHEPRAVRASFSSFLKTSPGELRANHPHPPAASRADIPRSDQTLPPQRRIASARFQTSVPNKATTAEPRPLRPTSPRGQQPEPKFQLEIRHDFPYFLLVEEIRRQEMFEFYRVTSCWAFRSASPEHGFTRPSGTR